MCAAGTTGGTNSSGLSPTRSADTNETDAAADCGHSNNNNGTSSPTSTAYPRSSSCGKLVPRICRSDYVFGAYTVSLILR